jgi:50S ribosomal protein L16 3-hydroxylase
VWDSLGDYVSEKEAFKDLYQDPDWSDLKNTSEIPQQAWKNAQKLLQQLINDEKMMKSWFGCFATRLDQQAEQQLPMPLEDDELTDLPTFINELKSGLNLIRDASCRFAYYQPENHSEYQFYINGCEWEIDGVSPELLSEIANNRFLANNFFCTYLNHEQNQAFLFDLWRLQWLQIEEFQ